VWESSGYNHGYWTADNEDWYQRRLKEIQSGGELGRPLSTNKWRQLLKNITAAPVKKLEDAISTACDKFLQGDGSYWKA
jgi:hypothetical protein